MDKQSATAIPALGRAQSSHAAVRLDLLSILHGPPHAHFRQGKIHVPVGWQDTGQEGSGLIPSLVRGFMATLNLQG